MKYIQYSFSGFGDFWSGIRQKLLSCIFSSNFNLMRHLDMNAFTILTHIFSFQKSININWQIVTDADVITPGKSAASSFLFC